MRLGDGRWRASGPEKFTFTEPDEDLAILRFRQWQASKQERRVSVPVDTRGLSVEEACRKVSRVGVRAVIGRGVPPVYSRAIPEEEFWATVRHEILTRPKYVARMTGIEQISYLADLPKPTPSPSLEEVGNLYLDHAKVSENWRAKCKLFWQEFRTAVTVPNLRDLTQEHLVEYADMIHEAAKTPTYARQRFGAVKAIVNYPTKRGKWAEDAKRVLAFCAVLVPPRKSAVAPEPIGREAFRTLYDAADDQMRAMFLLALNCCMYGGEVAALDWTDVDLERGTLSTERSKTGIVRIAVQIVGDLLRGAVNGRLAVGEAGRQTVHLLGVNGEYLGAVARRLWYATDRNR